MRRSRYLDNTIFELRDSPSHDYKVANEVTDMCLKILYGGFIHLINRPKTDNLLADHGVVKYDNGVGNGSLN